MEKFKHKLEESQKIENYLHGSIFIQTHGASGKTFIFNMSQRSCALTMTFQTSYYKNSFPQYTLEWTVNTNLYKHVHRYTVNKI